MSEWEARAWQRKPCKQTSITRRVCVRTSGSSITATSTLSLKMKPDAANWPTFSVFAYALPVRAVYLGLPGNGSWITRAWKELRT